jgi:hypothetical protein
VINKQVQETEKLTSDNLTARIVVGDKDIAFKICNELKEKLPYEISKKISFAVKEEKICLSKNYM